MKCRLEGNKGDEEYMIITLDWCGFWAGMIPDVLDLQVVDH